MNILYTGIFRKRKRNRGRWQKAMGVVGQE